MKHSKLTALIFIALFLGVIVGHFAPDFAVKMKPFAEIFLKIVTTLALIIGLTMGNIFQPGVGFVSGTSAHAVQMQEAGLMAATHAHTSIGAMVTDIFPTSIVDAMAKGNLLQIVVFSIFFALAICAVGKKAQPVLDILNSVSQIMFKFTEYVMYFAPLGIFGAIASTIGANGLGILKNYAKVIGALYFALAVFVLLVLIIACKIESLAGTGASGIYNRKLRGCFSKSNGHYGAFWRTEKYSWFCNADGIYL